MFELKTNKSVVKIQDDHAISLELKKCFNSVREVRPLELAGMLVTNDKLAESIVSGGWKHGEKIVNVPPTRISDLLAYVKQVNAIAPAYTAVQEAQKAYEAAQAQVDTNPVKSFFDAQNAKAPAGQRGRKTKVDETLKALGLA